jgi:hypothetical protein
MAAANGQQVWLPNYPAILFGIRQRIQEMLHAIEPDTVLGVLLNDGPRRGGSIGIKEHRTSNFVFPSSFSNHPKLSFFCATSF